MTSGTSPPTSARDPVPKMNHARRVDHPRLLETRRGNAEAVVSQAFGRSNTTRGSGLRYGQDISVRILEPRYPRAARRFPDSLRILIHSREPLEPNAPFDQIACGIADARHLPPDDREGCRPEILNL
jgi:hypothetical protein